MIWRAILRLCLKKPTRAYLIRLAITRRNQFESSYLNRSSLFACIFRKENCKVGINCMFPFGNFPDNSLEQLLLHVSYVSLTRYKIEWYTVIAWQKSICLRLHNDYIEWNVDGKNVQLVVHSSITRENGLSVFGNKRKILQSTF